MLILLRIFITVISAIFLALSFTNRSFQIFSFLFYLPFLDALCRLNGKKRYFFILLFYLTFWFVLTFWIRIFHFLALPSVLLGFTIYISLWTFLTSFILNKFQRYRVILIPVLIIALEYFTEIGYLGFPWGPAAGSVSFKLPLIQVADIGGVHFVSFLVVLVNMIVYEILSSLKEKNRLIKYSISLVIILILWYSYGIFRLSEPLSQTSFRAGLVQVNVNPRYDWQKIKDKVLERLEYYTAMAAKKNADIIIWAETSVLDYMLHYLRYVKVIPDYKDASEFGKKILSIPVKYKVPLLTGIPDVEISIDRTFHYYNSAIMINTNGRVIAKYDKIHLVPFGEWFPFAHIFPFIKKLLDSLEAGDYTPGKNYTLFPFKDKFFSVLICYEGVFGELAREFSKRGADFFINITDDMWNFDKRAHMQHTILDIFRAVENRSPFLRCGNSGITCIIDPHGKISDMIKPLQPGYLVSDVKFLQKKRITVFMAFGFLFGRLCLFFMLILATFTFILNIVSKIKLKD